MNTYEKNLEIFEDIKNFYADSAIRDRTYYPDFRRKWDFVFKKALERDNYDPVSDDGIFTVNLTLGCISTEFNFDQLKIDEWYQNEMKRKSKSVFYPKRLKRDRSGIITYQDNICRYNPDAQELALTEAERNIIACALPGLPPELSVVYGNKWVDDKFNVFLQRSISMYLIETDYVPAFLLSPFEVALYLFLMDYCIIKSDFDKVKDDDLRNYLHIFRPSPMLKIKDLL